MDGDRFAAVTEDGYVYLLSGNGSVLWRSGLGAPGISVDLSENGELVVAGGEDKANLFDGEGNTTWKGGRDVGDLRDAAIASDGSAIIVGSADHNVYSFDRFGNIRWVFDAGASVQAVGISRYGESVAAVTSAGDVIMLRSDGTPVWRAELGRYIGGVDFLGDGVVVRARSGVHLLEGGEIVWSEYFGSEIVAIDADDWSRAIAVMTANGEIHVLDETGRKRWKHALRQVGNSVALSRHGGVLVATGKSISYLSPPDLRPPVIKIVNPSNGSTVSGVVSIDAVADEPLGRLRVLIDGNFACESLPCSWDTGAWALGPHRITMRAEDTSGNAAEASIEVNVAEEIIPEVGELKEKIEEAVGGVEISPEEIAPRILRKRRMVLDISPLALLLAAMILVVAAVYLRGGKRKGYHWKRRR